MNSTLRQTVTVKQGGVVTVQSDELREGTAVDVVVSQQPHQLAAGQLPWTHFIGAGANPGRTVEQIDAELNALRDEWER